MCFRMRARISRTRLLRRLLCLMQADRLAAGNRTNPDAGRQLPGIPAQGVDGGSPHAVEDVAGAHLLTTAAWLAAGVTLHGGSRGNTWNRHDISASRRRLSRHLCFLSRRGASCWLSTVRMHGRIGTPIVHANHSVVITRRLLSAPQIYHLVGDPAVMFSPPLLLAALKFWLRSRFSALQRH